MSDTPKPVQFFSYDGREVPLVSADDLHYEFNKTAAFALDGKIQELEERIEKLPRLIAKAGEELERHKSNLIEAKKARATFP